MNFSVTRAVLPNEMLTRRKALSAGGVSLLCAACEAIGLKATIVTTTSVNGRTTTTVREAENWEEFEQSMGEVATEFSSFAEEVGETTKELGEKLVSVPPQGQVELGHLAQSLRSYQGDVRYDYLKVARMNPDAKCKFRYVQLGMPEFDNFFRASAEMYGAAYQLMETGRHVHLAKYKLAGLEPPDAVTHGELEIRKPQVSAALREVEESATENVAENIQQLKTLWLTTAELAVKLASKAVETARAGAALVTSAPAQLTNPKLVLHLDLIIDGLEQSVSMVKDTGVLLADIVA